MSRYTVVINTSEDIDKNELLEIIDKAVTEKDDNAEVSVTQYVKY